MSNENLAIVRFSTNPHHPDPLPPGGEEKTGMTERICGLDESSPYI